MVLMVSLSTDRYYLDLFAEGMGGAKRSNPKILSQL